MKNEIEQTSELDKIFKIPGSKKEKITVTETFTTSWICENGQKIKLLGKQTNTNTTSDVLDPGTLDNLEDKIADEAINYVEGTLVKSYYEQMPEAYGNQDLWGKMVANFIKPQPLIFIIKLIIHLKERAVPLTLNKKNLGDYLIEELKADLKEKHNELSPEKKTVFATMLSNKPELTFLTEE